MFMENQPDISTWMSENNIKPEFILGADAMDQVIFDSEDPELDEDCYDNLPYRYTNGYSLSNNSSISPITIPIIFKDEEGKTHIPFEDERSIDHESDTLLNSFLEIKAPTMEAEITTIGFTVVEDDRGKYHADDPVIYRREIKPEELDAIRLGAGIATMDAFMHMVAEETYLDEHGPRPFRGNAFEQLFDAKIYAERVQAREKLLDSIVKAMEAADTSMKKDDIRIENDWQFNSNIPENEIVFYDAKNNKNSILTDWNGEYYKAQVDDGKVKEDSIVEVEKLKLQDKDHRVEYYTSHAMDLFMGFRATELGVDRHDIELKNDRAVLNTDGDLSRYDHLYVKSFEGSFEPISEFNTSKIEHASVYSEIATEAEAFEYNKTHQVVIENTNQDELVDTIKAVEEEQTDDILYPAMDFEP